MDAWRLVWQMKARLADNFCAWPYLDPHKCVQMGQSCSLLIRSRVDPCWANPSAGEQLLEAMMAQGLAPSIYTLSVVVKYLGSIDSIEKSRAWSLASFPAGSLPSCHNMHSKLKSPCNFWANKHEWTPESQGGTRRFTKKMRDRVSSRLGNASWHPNEMTSFANDASNIVKTISSLLWISPLILCYFLLLILCHSLAKSRIHTCNATLKIWNAQAACQCQAVGQGFQESQQQEVWGETRGMHFLVGF